MTTLSLNITCTEGGTAGNVIANRLSENPDYSVLVIEAGGSNVDVVDITVPFYGPRAVPDTPQDWNYTTTPQVNLNGRSLAYPRGFVLGGSSSVNDMVYTRGSKEDFDRFARVTGDEGWTWDSLVPYMRMNERFSPPVDHHNATDQFNPAVHGFSGIDAVSLAGFPTSIDSRVIETTTESKEFPFNLDMNSGYQLGIGWVQTTIKNGSRSSSATSYLASEFIASRPSLNVLLHARVTRVLQSGLKTFRTVELVQDINGKRFTLTAKKEVILSAGTIGTPSILLHSGIGNSSTLTSLGIEPLHDLPSVGQNLSDHALVALSWLVNSNDTFETAGRNTTLAEEEFDQWNTTRTGPLVDTPTSHLGWLRIARDEDSTSIFEDFPDPAAGPNTSHYEFVVSNGFVGPTPPTGNFLTITVALVSPLSRGTVTLNSSDPLSAPLINPNFLDHELDVFILRAAIRSAMRFVATPAWANYIISPVDVNVNATDAELDEYIHNKAGAVYHPVGTASMSPKGASYGVVDPDLRVKGLSGLRVVDISVAPFIPAAHTQAPTYFIAERAAYLVKEYWN
ncbi:aryl-alcohol-oxidase from pleurotus Eryingii [Mycena rosella]|uniref:Aryl-alcohol-oxidase from pleurotus Eryingii n=1 Tax=Mycena rosella TaxID=1033263 RepID=A0AAD7M740_MYCRO|nr:aryl-alcohol-oxidase from pleurotus Eryingii [Mycena rosella]